METSDEINLPNIPFCPNWPHFFPVVYLNKSEVNHKAYISILKYAIAATTSIISPILNIIGLAYDIYFRKSVYRWAFYDLLSPFILIFILYRPLYRFYVTGQKSTPWNFLMFYYLIWCFFINIGHAQLGHLGFVRLTILFMWGPKRIVKYIIPIVTILTTIRFIFLFEIFLDVMNPSTKVIKQKNQKKQIKKETDNTDHINIDNNTSQNDDITSQNDDITSQNDDITSQNDDITSQI